MIFFLDMDGVINTSRVAVSKPGDQAFSLYGHIDPICVNYINRWADIIDTSYGESTRIVLTSTWRARHSNYSTVDMMLSGMGVSPPAHHDFATRRTAMSINGVTDMRGFQINDWLREHPEETNWIIIDDDGDMMDEQKDRFIQTHYRDGILFKHHLQFETIVTNMYGNAP